MTEQITPEESLQQLADLMSAPLIAAAQANAKMSQAQIDFLLAYCFTKNGDSYTPKMVKMELTRNVITPAVPGEIDQSPKIVEGTTSFDLPLLTIIPLSSLAVNQLEVKFEMDISHLENNPEGEPQLLGKILKGTKEEGIKMDVSLNAALVPLPAGMVTIIEAFTKSVQPISH
ncbi:DUF2589 domain-containing protein [Pedobacter sp.]|uniref:DUF2589 domain-containing protein n=1 Tax=Pedobacter sp. TaxID=1411316 RepID=UPI0031D76AA3